MIHRTNPWTFYLVFLAVLAQSSPAQESNRNEVRARLESSGWRVVWGKNFTEADWARGLKAIAESIATENAAPFLAWFEATLNENFQKIQNNLKGITRADLQRWIAQSLKRKQLVSYRGLKIEAGFATYNRWKRVVYNEPRTRKVMKKDRITGIKTYVPEFYTERVEKRVPLPNWHQFYIRYQLVPAQAGPGGSSRPGPKPPIVRPPAPKPPAGSRISYSIRNDAGRAVKFRLPSGQAYVLQPGARGSYTATGSPGAFKIHVLDSGRTYSLLNGNHRFWWMSKERRIGFDLNYDRKRR